MVSKDATSAALLVLFLNLVFFSSVSSNSNSTTKVVPANDPDYKYYCPDLRICTNIWVPPYKAAAYCCPQLKVLDDFQATECLCPTVKANVDGILGLRRNYIVDLVLNNCGRRSIKFYCN